VSRHIRIPFLLDLYRVRSSHLILQEANNPDLDRDYVYRGPLINRLIIARMKAAMRVKTLKLDSVSDTDTPNSTFLEKMLTPPLRVARQWFPSAQSLSDLARISDQASLESRLSAADNMWDTGLIKEAAKFVRSETQRPADEIAQELTGRLFVENFVSNAQTVRAGKRINHAIRSFNPLRWIFWIATRGLDTAHSCLSEAMGGNLSGVHAISIAVHNISKSMESMQILFNTGYQTASVNEIRARIMHAPENILRQSKTVSSSQMGPLRPGTLVIFSAHEAAKKHLDSRLAFMTTSPSKCPAHQAVPHLLDQIWMEAING